MGFTYICIRRPNKVNFTFFEKWYINEALKAVYKPLLKEKKDFIANQYVKQIREANEKRINDLISK